MLLAIAGLVLGISLGFALVGYIKRELVSYLDDMVRRSCDCKFEVDRVELSIPTLSAVARNARIVSAGETRLQFKKITASASLLGIFDHIIPLSISLSGGMARQVDEESVTYKFIDFLSAPFPAERDYPDRWKVRLTDLDLKNASFIQRFPSFTLRAKGITLDLSRDARDDFLLEPRIEALIADIPLQDPVQGTPASHSITLGTVKSQLLIKENLIDFTKIILEREKAWVKIAAVSHTDQHNAIEGEMEYVVDAASVGLGADAHAELRGTAKLSGFLVNPDFKGEFSTAAGSETRIALPAPGADLIFESAKGLLDFKMNSGDTRIVIDALEAHGESSRVLLASPLRLYGREVSGALDLQVGALATPAFGTENLSMKLDLSGDVVAPDLALKGSLGMLETELITLGPLEFNGRRKSATLSLAVHHKTPQRGSISFDSNIALEQGRASEIKNLDFEFQDLDLMEGGSKIMTIAGTGTLHGPVDPQQLFGELRVTIESGGFSGTNSLSGLGTLKDGRLNIDLESPSKSLKAHSSLGFSQPAQNSLLVKLSNFSFSEYDSAVQCVTLSGALDYRFDNWGYLGGTGVLALDRVSLGCAPYALENEAPIRIPLLAGGATLDGVRLIGKNSSVQLSGSAHALSGLKLQCLADLQARALLPFLPAFDDVSGSLQAAISISGPVSAPQVSGTATISAGEFSLEAVDISATAINGQIELTQDRMHIKGVDGVINNGGVRLQGFIYPLDFSASTLSAVGTGIELSPAADTFLVLSGDLALRSSESGEPVIAGALRIDQGEFEKQFDLAAILRILADTVFSTSNLPIPNAKIASAELADTQLDLHVGAERNLLLLTNWASAELGADIKISGTLAQPFIAGTTEIISGWFGVKDRRLSITSGKLLISSELEEPLLDILAESTIRTTFGENVLVFLEAKGPLTAPTIHLSSDHGYSERELLSLITSSYGVSTDLSVDTLLLAPLRLETRPVESDSTFEQIRSALAELAHIDDFTLEPSYNEQTGAIDPKIVATKNITDEIDLIGQQTFRSDIRESDLRLRYRLMPELALSGRVSSDSLQERASLGIDLSYAIIPERNELLSIDIKGAQALDRKEILRALRIDGNSRIAPDDFPALAGRLLEEYHKRGYVQASISTRCLSGAQLCREALVEIDQKELAKIVAVQLRGDDVSLILKDLRGVTDQVGKRSSAYRRERASELLIKRLRSEGYVGARVAASFNDAADPLNKELVLDVSLGRPVTFIFSGNSAFIPEEFLDTINLFERQQPFGRNTINILVENMELLYRRNGYLYATIRHSEEEEDSSERIIYRVWIEEGPQVPVGRVELLGSDYFTTAMATQRLADRDESLRAQVFSPSYAVAEELEYNLRILREIFAAEGYPEVRLRYEIKPSEDERTVDVIYHVTAGEPLAVVSVGIENVPAELPLPAQPEAPYSISKLNKYQEELVASLGRAGYRTPLVSSSFDAASGELRLNIEPGEQSIISSIHISGNDSITSETIERNLKVHAGDVWDEELLDASRRTLLRLGLFSRVEIGAADGALDSLAEVLAVKVVERNLQALELGGGVDSEFGMHVFGEASDKTFFRDGRVVSLRLDGFYDPTTAEISKGVASARFSNPYLFSSEYRFTEDLRFQRLENANQEFDLGRVSLASYIDRAWGSHFEMTIGHTILFDDISDVSPDVIIGEFDEGAVRLGFLSGVLIYDKRDYVLNPSDGYLLSLDYKVASEVLGSQASFAGLGGKFSYILPLTQSPRFTLASNTRLAGLWSFSDTGEIPITQRLYLGGQDSVRGFRENSLGPAGDLGGVIGGDLLFSNNFEIRYGLGENLALHTFFDAGTVFLQDNAVDLGDLRTSAGIGIRYLSPIGPIGFDLGSPLDEKEGEPSVRFHFRVGSTF